MRQKPPWKPARSVDIHCLICDAAVSLKLMGHKPANANLARRAESVWHGVCEGCKAETDVRTHGGPG
jgi:hypothetical protein